MADIKKLLEMDPDQLLAELRNRAAGKGSRAAGHPDLREFDDATLAEAVKSGQKVIYGTDDRVEVFTLPPGADLDDVDSVVALFRNSDITDKGNGTSTLATQNFGTARNLCASERFRDQPIGSACSGFLVAPDVIATAGHCINAGNVTTLRFVFGFRMSNATTAVTTVSNSEIYSGVSLIGREEVDAGADWALVKIDRPVLNHRVVRIRRSGKIDDGQAVHVIGHPSNLPTKFAGGAAVRNNSPGAFFVANLDSYGGNSGSPVFNSTTHDVEGILVRGDADFVLQGGCNVSLVCPSTGCNGEEITRTTEFCKFVPVTSIWPTGHVFFFKGSQYSRYHVANDRVDAGFPRPIAGNWPGFPAHFAAGVSAWLMWTDGKAYFFKGSEYLRYDVAADKVDPGYPKPIADNWPGLFTSNIDAALVWNNGKAYFFSGSQYLRYDVATDKTDAGFPKAIAGNWPGFPAQFTVGVNAAVMWNNGKAYFFKGSEFLRYDVAADKVDPGYPKPTADNWPGLFSSGIDA